MSDVEEPEPCKGRMCEYRLELDGIVIWECRRPALSERKKYCLFHDPDHWRENPDEVRQEFYELVRQAIENGEPLMCIGYHLPDIRLTDEELGVEVEFRAPVIFRDAHFHGCADFSGAQFQGYADFSGSTVLGKLLFKRDPEHSPLFPLISSPSKLDLRVMARFHSIRFKLPEKPGVEGRLIFDGVAMHRVSLMDTDLSHVEFRDVDWWEFKGAYMTIGQAVFLIANSEEFTDEYCEWAGSSWLKALILMLKRGLRRPSELLCLPSALRYVKSMAEKARRERDELREECGKIARRYGFTFDNVLQELRNLRDWHDRRMRYERGGRFFISEMDTKRWVGPRAAQQGAEKGRLKRFASWLERLIITFYRWLCLYGESMARPLAGLFLAWLVFGLFYALWPPSVLQDVPGLLGLLSAPQQLPLALYKGLELSFSALLQMPPPTSEASVVAERALSVLLMGSFLTALKRKLERKMRRGG